MSQPIGKKRIHELDNFSGDLKGAVVLLSKEEKEYKIGIAELQGVTEPEYYFVIPIAGQSNAMSYGEGLPLPATLDAPDPRIKQMARRAKVSPNGADCKYNDVIPADHCLHDVQDMSVYSHPNADLSKGEYGCVGQGLHIAKRLLPYIPSNAGILLVPCARGGSAFTTGAEGTFDEATGATATSSLWGVDKPLYKDLVSRTKKALDVNPKNKLLAVVWMQGEFDLSNANFAQQPALFNAMVERFRTDLSDHLSQMPEFDTTEVPWICGDTTYYWKDKYPAQYETVYGNYRNNEQKNIFFVPFMYDDNDQHVPTNDPTDDPDITGATYYGAASRSSGNWTSAERNSHFSSWARRGIISERIAAEILSRTEIGAMFLTKNDTKSSKDNLNVVRSYTPLVESVGYNGRRGDGSLQGQGWNNIVDCNVTAQDSEDGNGHFIELRKAVSKKTWKVARSMTAAADMIRYGGRLTITFRLKGDLTENRFGLGLYWRISASDLPTGTTLADAGVAKTYPFLMSFFLQTDATNLNLMHHKKQNAELETFGPFDNDWHTLEIIYPGDNKIKVTPVLDGKNGTPFDLANSPANTGLNELVLTDITKAAAYDIDISKFEISVNRDSGSIVLAEEDVSSYVYFPPTNRGGQLTIPDLEYSVGRNIQIVANKAGSITVKPQNSNVLITPKGETEGLAKPIETTESITLMQIGSDGKSWVVI